jgi:lipoprotein NlpD
MLLALAAWGCAQTVSAPPVTRTGVYHEVRTGENLYRIGMAYGIAHQELARINGISNPDRLRVGQRIFIPGGTRALPVSLITPERATDEAPSSRELPRGQGVFIWPLERGVVTSKFGPRGQSFHDGIDIGAPVGTTVRCAREGRVIYSDTLRGYGNVVIVQHPGGYATVYAHNAENLVRDGAHLRQGDVVARVGRSGRTTGPNLHFEIRKDNIARNPVYFLPTETAERGKDHST